jgi:hypothetical protein
MKLDLVAEGVAWFETEGSMPLVLRVDAAGRHRAE